MRLEKLASCAACYPPLAALPGGQRRSGACRPFPPPPCFPRTRSSGARGSCGPRVAFLHKDTRFVFNISERTQTVFSYTATQTPHRCSACRQAGTGWARCPLRVPADGASRWWGARWHSPTDRAGPAGAAVCHAHLLQPLRPPWWALRGTSMHTNTPKVPHPMAQRALSPAQPAPADPHPLPTAFLLEPPLLHHHLGSALLPCSQLLEVVFGSWGPLCAGEGSGHSCVSCHGAAHRGGPPAAFPGVWPKLWCAQRALWVGVGLLQPRMRDSGLCISSPASQHCSFLWLQ